MEFMTYVYLGYSFVSLYFLFLFILIYIQRKKEMTHIPPLIPLFVNINHKEFLVSVQGKVRINGKSEQIKKLYGVMEEHFGIW